MLSHFGFRSWMKRALWILLILLLLFVLTISMSVTFVEIRRHQTLVLPAPTGPYAVGRIEYDWTDQSRPDPLVPLSSMKRELVVWVWYPALREPGAVIAPYLPSRWAQLADSQHGFIGQQLLQSTDSIQAYSLESAPLAPAAARYPVLIFEPGLGNIPTQYTTLLEDLASRGYVIFAITPTYSSDVVVFPDGRVASANPAGSLEDVANLQASGNRLVTVWAQDVIFVMNRLEQLDATPGNMWSQRLDLARLGVFGHSFGGATAAQVCQMDARCKAGIDIDGDLFGNVVQTGLAKPFMVIQSDKGSCSDANCRLFQLEIGDILRTVPQGESYSISVTGTQHFNFGDYAVSFSPLRAFGLLGPIEGARGLQITRAYVAAFFDTSLNKMPSPLLQGESHSYPEVHFSPP